MRRCPATHVVDRTLLLSRVVGRRIEDFSDSELVDALNVEPTGEAVTLGPTLVQAELTRRNTAALVTAARRTECLTWALVVLTVVLVVLVDQGLD